MLEKNGFQPILHKRPIKGAKLEPLLQSINATAKLSGGSPFGILAYSWGAYLALAYLHRFPENVSELFLVNPMLVDQDHTKPLILTAPLLRTLTYRLRNRSLATAYVEKSFEPDQPPTEIKSRLEKDLMQLHTWRGESVYQKLLEVSPLQQDFSRIYNPVHIIVGEKDTVAPLQDQMLILQTLPNHALITVPGAGHALPWTHPELIIQTIENESFASTVA